MLAGFEIAVNDPLLVRGFEGLGDLLRDRQRLVNRDRAAGDAFRKRRALDQILADMEVLRPIAAKGAAFI